MLPVRYQPREEAGWQRWVLGQVDTTALNLKVDSQQDYCFVNGCMVFALIDENEKIWNCRYGWLKKGML